MNDVSILIIVDRESRGLEDWLKAVATQTSLPREVIIVYLEGEPSVPFPDEAFPIRQLTPEHSRSPLSYSSARNLAAAMARGEILAFLDCQTLPDPDYLESIDRLVRLTHGLIVGRPPVADQWEYLPLPYSDFSSRSFALRTEDFERLGGFDQHYRGHGCEDLDFAFMARQVRLPCFICGTGAYPSDREETGVPSDKLEDFVTDALRFHAKWKQWPREDWLKNLEQAGRIEWEAESITICP